MTGAKGQEGKTVTFVVTGVAEVTIPTADCLPGRTLTISRRVRDGTGKFVPKGPADCVLLSVDLGQFVENSAQK